MAIPSYKNRVAMSVSGTPGTGTITLGSAESGRQSFASAYGADANVDVLIVDGTAWEVARDCTYTHSGTTLTRGTLEASSTGSALSLTSAAKVYVTQTAARLQSMADLMDHMDRKINGGCRITTNNTDKQTLTNSAYTTLHGGSGGCLKTVEWDPDNLFDSTTGKITLPEGRWMIYGYVSMVALSDTKRYIVAIAKNGEATPSSPIGRGSSGGAHAHASGGMDIVESSGTDYWNLQIYQDDTGSEETQEYTGWVRFGAEYMGPLL